MSKSLKNFVSISELLNKFKGETIRYFLLQSHYRAPLNFSNNSLLEANTSLSSLYRSVEDLSVNGDPDKEILTNLEDDVNTPKVFLDYIICLNKLTREVLSCTAFKKFITNFRIA